MIGTGILLGFWVDLYKFIHRWGRNSCFPLLDLLFWAVIICTVFIVLLNTNYLELRIYVFFSLGLGLLLYLKICSRYILQLYSGGFVFILKMIRWMRSILYPMIVPLQFFAGIMDIVTESILNLVAMLSLAVYQRTKQDNPPIA